MRKQPMPSAQPLHTSDPDWNAFAQQTDDRCVVFESMQWIPEQIVGIGEDLHSQLDDGEDHAVQSSLERI
jgi:hypothetical protein